MNTAKKK